MLTTQDRFCPGRPLCWKEREMARTHDEIKRDRKIYKKISKRLNKSLGKRRRFELSGASMLLALRIKRRRES